MVNLEKIKEIFFYLSVFFLPVNQKINHWFFGLFMLISIILFFSRPKYFWDLKKFKYLILAISSFFILKLIGLINVIDLDTGLKEITRALPFVLYPLCILSFDSKSDLDYSKFKNNVFYILVFGCVLTTLICWGNVMVSYKFNDIPANQFFGWKRSGTYLTQILNLHPPYLGLLINIAILFLGKELFFNKSYSKFKQIGIIFLIGFLIVFLFNLTARNSLLFLFITIMTFLIWNKKWKLLAIPIIVVLMGLVVVLNHPSEYYRIKLYRMFNPDEDVFKEKRFTRLEGSWEIFKSNPILGVGGGNNQIERNKQYLKRNDNVAFDKSLNSHNQIFEYLVTHGLIGGLTFILINILFLYYLIKNREYFFLVLYINFIFSTLSESIFSRALGIQYYSVITSLLILEIYNNKKLTRK